MKNKQVKQCLSLLLGVIFIALTAVSVFAAGSDDSGIRPLSDYPFCTISISGLSAACHAEITTDTSQYIEITMELQKLSDDDMMYHTVKTWTDSTTSNFFSLSKSRLINAFAVYRLKSTFVTSSTSYIRYAYP